MTDEEALAVIEIMATADSGCSDCVRDQWKKLAERFPEIGFDVFARANHNRYWNSREMAAEAWEDLDRRPPAGDPK